MCIDLREVGGSGAITMQQVMEYTLSLFCPVDLSVTQCTGGFIQSTHSSFTCD